MKIEDVKRYADAHLQALLRYTKGFYEAAIENGMKRGETANAVAHVERAARALHLLATVETPGASGEATATSILAELVRLKDLKQRLETRDFSGPLISAMTEEEHKEGKKDYLENQPKAWALARAHLAHVAYKIDMGVSRQDSHAMYGTAKAWTIGERSNQYRISSDSHHEQTVLETMGKAKFEGLSICGFDGKQACIVPLDESSRATAEFIVDCVHAYAKSQYVAQSYKSFIPVMEELKSVSVALGQEGLVPSIDVALQGLKHLDAAEIRLDQVAWPKGPRSEPDRYGQVRVEVLPEVAPLAQMLPEDPTPEMLEAVQTIVGKYPATLIWQRMREVLLGRP